MFHLWNNDIYQLFLVMCCFCLGNWRYSIACLCQSNQKPNRNVEWPKGLYLINESNNGNREDCRNNKRSINENFIDWLLEAKLFSRGQKWFDALYKGSFILWLSFCILRMSMYFSDNVMYMYSLHESYDVSTIWKSICWNISWIRIDYFLSWCNWIREFETSIICFDGVCSTIF